MSQHEAHMAFINYLKKAQPKLRDNFIGFWKSRAHTLPKEGLTAVGKSGIVGVALRNRVRQDIADLIGTVLTPAWEEAYASGGGEEPIGFILSRELMLNEMWFQEQMRAFSSASAEISLLTAKDADSPMLRNLYGLTEGDALAVCRYHHSLVNKSFLRSVVGYAARKLIERARTVSGYEVPAARQAGEREAAIREVEERRETAFLSGTLPDKPRGPMEKVWHIDPTSNVCMRCYNMDEEVVGINEMFSEGVDENPLHPLCACRVEYREGGG